VLGERDNGAAASCDSRPALQHRAASHPTPTPSLPPPPTPQFNTNDTKSCAAAGSNCVWVAKDAPSKSGKGRPAGCYSKARASASPEEVGATRASALDCCPDPTRPDPALPRHAPNPPSRRPPRHPPLTPPLPPPPTHPRTPPV
jgi:hypothetical protein